MDKGSEIAFKLQNVDCDPKLKEIIINQGQDLFFLRKQMIELATNFDHLASQMITLTNGTAGFMNDIKRIRKILKTDEALSEEE